MTTEINNGGHAFPQHGWNNSPEVQKHMQDKMGMTLRDYFAAKAMAALIDGYDTEARMRSQNRMDRTGFDDNPHADSDATYASQLAGEAYIIADAMLIARQSGGAQ